MGTLYEKIEFAFYGALIFQMSFMFILYLQNRKPYYIIYTLYVLGVFLVMEPKVIGVINAYIFLLEWSTVLAYFLFLESFLEISKQSERFKRFMYFLKLTVIALLCIQFALTLLKENFGPMDNIDWLAHRIDEYFFYATFIAGAFTLYETYQLKNVLSRYILVGTGVLLVSLILNRVFYDFFTVLPIIFGTFFELLLFVAAIGYKTNLLEIEKRRAQEQLMRTTLMALKDQMSPHFIANCLNSIKLLIQQKKEKEAIDYLTEFSKLHRLVVEHFQDVKVSLQKELDICKLYLEMERYRFKQSFNYTFDIQVDDNLLTFIEIPPLLFQPIIENALWHGLMKKEGAKELRIQLRNKGKYLECTIEDNGVGRPSTKKALQSEGGTKNRKSTGIANTQEKISVYNQLFHNGLNMELIDKVDREGKPQGLKVVFTIFYD